jgi:hypothetical protein
MRIISKFHDYYDIGLSQGQDETLVYSRVLEENVITEDGQVGGYYSKGNFHPFADYTGRISVGGTNLNCEGIVIGFCGNVYWCVEFEYTNTYCPEKNQKRYCYNIEQVDEFISGLDDKFINKRYESEKSYWTFFSRETIIDKFKSFDTMRDKHIDYFRKLNTPVFVVHREFNSTRKKWELNFTKNPCLLNYHFQRVFDSYTAFQEVSMFLGGVLGRGEKETLARKDFPDEPLIRDSKGFDKWSFKKRPI